MLLPLEPPQRSSRSAPMKEYDMNLALEVLGLLTLLVMVCDHVHEVRVAKPRRMSLSRR